MGSISLIILEMLKDSNCCSWVPSLMVGLQFHCISSILYCIAHLTLIIVFVLCYKYKLVPIKEIQSVIQEVTH